MNATVLIDNNAPDGLLSEWGLSIYIEHEGRKLLLDTGASGAFAQNADRLGIDLAEINIGVLSHAHYDHADGLEKFFEKNGKANFYLREGTREDCYKTENTSYIGIKKGTLGTFSDRIIYVSGLYELCPDAWLLGHDTPGLAAAGERAGMLRNIEEKLVPDDFSHEQSLIVKDRRGLTIFSSCSHAGVDVIIKETVRAFPGERLHAFVGGLHLFQTPGENVKKLAEEIKATGIDRIVTGHCTGEEAENILAEELGERFELFTSGYRI